MATQFITPKIVHLPPVMPQRPEVLRARPRRRPRNISAIAIAAVQYDGRLS